MVEIIPVHSMKVLAEEKCNINLRDCFYLQGDLCLVVVEIHYEECCVGVSQYILNFFFFQGIKQRICECTGSWV